MYDIQDLQEPVKGLHTNFTHLQRDQAGAVAMVEYSRSSNSADIEKIPYGKLARLSIYRREDLSDSEKLTMCMITDCLKFFGQPGKRIAVSILRGMAGGAAHTEKTYRTHIGTLAKAGAVTKTTVKGQPSQIEVSVEQDILMGWQDYWAENDPGKSGVTPVTQMTGVEDFTPVTAKTGVTPVTATTGVDVDPGKSEAVPRSQLLPTLTRTKEKNSNSNSTPSCGESIPSKEEPPQTGGDITPEPKQPRPDNKLIWGSEVLLKYCESKNEANNVVEEFLKLVPMKSPAAVITLATLMDEYGGQVVVEAIDALRHSMETGAEVRSWRGFIMAVAKRKFVEFGGTKDVYTKTKQIPRYMQKDKHGNFKGM